MSTSGWPRKRSTWSSSAIRRRSQASASSQPPPRARPLIAAMNTLSMRRMCAVTSWNRFMSATPASRVRRSSFLAPGKWRRRLSLSSSRRVSQAGMEKVMGATARSISSTSKWVRKTPSAAPERMTAPMSWRCSRSSSRSASSCITAVVRKFAGGLSSRTCRTRPRCSMRRCRGARVIAASSLDNERYIKIIIQCDDIVSPTNG